jgi:hypothetical protein
MLPNLHNETVVDYERLLFEPPHHCKKQSKTKITGMQILMLQQTNDQKRQSNVYVIAKLRVFDRLQHCNTDLQNRNVIERNHNHLSKSQLNDTLNHRRSKSKGSDQKATYFAPLRGSDFNATNSNYDTKILLYAGVNHALSISRLCVVNKFQNTNMTENINIK